MQEKYTKAPIVESLIEIKFAEPLPSMSSTDAFEQQVAQLHARIQDRYPDTHKIRNAEIELDVDASVTERFFGQRFISEDKTCRVSVTLESFAFTQYGTYQDWETFSQKAADAYDCFTSAFSTPKIEAIRVRNINLIRLDITKNQNINISDFLVSAPSVPLDLPQETSNFLMRLQLPIKEIDAVCHITQTPNEISEDHMSIILDVDIFRKMSNNGCNVWSLFDEIRPYKNKYFQAFLTDKAKKLFR